MIPITSCTTDQQITSEIDIDSKDFTGFRFIGPFSLVQMDLDAGDANGFADWCHTFRKVHHILDVAPSRMLVGLAKSAPSRLLAGYVFGLLYARDDLEEADVTPKEWIARADSSPDRLMRGLALACAVMTSLDLDRPSKSRLAANS